MKTTILLLITLLTACQTVNIPCKSDFDYVSKKKYELNVYDCSNKSAEYLTLLQNKGFNDSRIWTFQVQLYKGLGLYAYHAVVEVNGIFLDPTTGRVIKAFRADLIRKQSTAKTISFKQLQELIKSNPQEWAFKGK